jgi:hypothetical protein
MFALLRAAFGCTFAFIAAGCVSQAGNDTARLREISALSDSEIQECKRLYPDPNARPVSPRVKCIGDATVRAARAAAKIGYKNVDLDELASAQMILLAEQFDAGKMTEAEYDVEQAKIISARRTQSLQRQNSQAMVSAAQAQASAASAQAIAASKPVNCTTIGSTTTCY